MLAIDYGHDVPEATGDTLQAVYQHKFCPVLDHLGEADLTSHVDFARLGKIARDTGCSAVSTTQGVFLKNLGIETRLAQLLEKNPGADLEMGVARLTESAQMGRLFRVIGISGSAFSQLPGL